MPVSLTERRALQAALIATALLPLVTGPAAYLLGGRAIFGARRWDAPIDGELRYLSVFWTAAGLRLLGSVPDIEREGKTVREVGALLVLGGLGRVLAWRSVGPPHPVMRAATVIEIVLPLVLAAWQARIAAQKGSCTR